MPPWNTRPCPCPKQRQLRLSCTAFCPFCHESLRNRLQGMQIELVTLRNGEPGVYAHPWMERQATMEYWPEIYLPLAELSLIELYYVQTYAVSGEERDDSSG